MKNLTATVASFLLITAHLTMKAEDSNIQHSPQFLEEINIVNVTEGSSIRYEGKLYHVTGIEKINFNGRNRIMAVLSRPLFLFNVIVAHEYVYLLAYTETLQPSGETLVLRALSHKTASLAAKSVFALCCAGAFALLKLATAQTNMTPTQIVPPSPKL